MNNSQPSHSYSKGTLLMVVADDRFFVSHRMEVGRGAQRDGWRVVVVAGNNGAEKAIREAGLEYIALPRPTSMSEMTNQLRLVKYLVAVFKRYPGAVVHLIGMKMLAAGNLAARLSGRIKGIVNAVCGLGISFQNPMSVKARVTARMLRMVWRHESGDTTIVQNHDDERILLNHGVINEKEIVYIKGSGVDLKKFNNNNILSTLPDGRMRVTFSARLLKSKGVEDFIEAAELLREEWSDRAEFMICGGVHSNPDSLTSADMTRLCDGHYIVWAGECRNMPEILSSSRLMVLPSYYREGVPLALIEASAAGLPIVTCDSVGCRDTIDGNGYLIPPRSPRRLAERIRELLLDSELCIRFGKRSREIAERDYAIENVVSKHLSIYSAMLK